MLIKSRHHISKKKKIEMRVLCFFFNAAVLFFYIFLGFVCVCTELPFFPNFPLHLVYFWVWWYIISLMLRLLLLILVPEYLCLSVLTCTILVGKINKIFVLITQTIESLHGLYCMVFKNMWFWCDTKSKLVSGLHGGSNKSSFLSDPLTGWVKLP